MSRQVLQGRTQARTQLVWSVDTWYPLSHLAQIPELHFWHLLGQGIQAPLLSYRYFAQEVQVMISVAAHEEHDREHPLQVPLLVTAKPFRQPVQTPELVQFLQFLGHEAQALPSK